MKEIKEDINSWKDIPCLWIGRINIVKNYIIQGNLQIQYIPYQITMAFFTELEKQQQKQISKFVWRHIRPHIAKLTVQYSVVSHSL